MNLGVAVSKGDILKSRCPVVEAFEYTHWTSLGDPLPVAIAKNGVGGNFQRVGILLSISPR